MLWLANKKSVYTLPSPVRATYYLLFGICLAWRGVASPRPNHETPLPRPLRDGWAALISTDKTQTGVIRFLIGPWRGTALSVCKVAFWYSGSVDQKEEHRTEATDRRVFLEHRLLTRTPRT